MAVILIAKLLPSPIPYTIEVPLLVLESLHLFKSAAQQGKAASMAPARTSRVMRNKEEVFAIPYFPSRIACDTSVRRRLRKERSRSFEHRLRASV
jgi:hypothetical protein